MINFWKNVIIAGAFLLLAITGPGAFSSIAWKVPGCGVNALSGIYKCSNWRNDISEIVDSLVAPVDYHLPGDDGHPA